MKPDTIYFDLIRCEDRSADLYLDLSVRFCDQAELSWFWVEMAMSEKQRAGLLYYCLENKLFARDLPDPVAIEAFQKRLDELCRRTEDPSLSLDAAFDIAIQLETADINDIRFRLTMPIEGPAYVLQKKQDVERDNHFARLRTAAERFDVSPALRSRLTGAR